MFYVLTFNWVSTSISFFLFLCLQSLFFSRPFILQDFNLLVVYSPIEKKLETEIKIQMNMIGGVL